MDGRVLELQWAQLGLGGRPMAAPAAAARGVGAARVEARGRALAIPPGLLAVTNSGAAPTGSGRMSIADLYAPRISR